MNKPRVLVVEDNKDLRDLYSFVLSSSGCEVMEAVNGIEALELLKKEKPDVVLTDIQMPNMDGIELIKWIRTDTDLADLPIIAISSWTDTTIRSAARLMGATKMLEKPIDPFVLFDAVWELLPTKDACAKSAA